MAFIGLLAYLFFFFIRLQDWWGPLNTVPVDYIVISVIGISFILSFPRFINILRLPQNSFLLLFAGVVVLSNITNDNTSVAFEYGLKYLKFTIIFFAIVFSIDSFTKLKWIVPYVIALIIFIAYQGIIQAKTGTNWAGQSLYWAGRIRWVGLFDGANSTALAFMLATPFILEYLFVPWSKIYKIFSITAAYFVTIGFYLTNSRGGFISFLTIVFSFIYSRVKNKRGLILGFILIFALFTVAAPSRMSDIDDSEKSTRGRIKVWGEALEMVRYHNPLFGIGKGQFTKYTTIVAHNAFLQQLGETGLIGVFFLLGSVYTTILGLKKVFKKEGIDILKLSLYRGYFFAFIGLLVGVMFISADDELFYIWMGFCTSIMLIEGIEIRITLRDLINIGIIEISGVIGAYTVVNLFKFIYF